MRYTQLIQECPRTQFQKKVLQCSYIFALPSFFAATTATLAASFGSISVSIAIWFLYGPVCYNVEIKTRFEREFDYLQNPRVTKRKYVISIEPKIRGVEENKKVEKKRTQKRGTCDRSCYIMHQMRLPFGKSPFFGTHHES